MSLRAQRKGPRPAPHIVHVTEVGIYRYKTVAAEEGYELHTEAGIAIPVQTALQARAAAREMTEYLATNPICIPIPLDARMPIRRDGGAS